MDVKICIAGFVCTLALLFALADDIWWEVIYPVGAFILFFQIPVTVFLEWKDGRLKG